MTDVVVLAYEKLIADVRAEFEEEGLNCKNLFGWRVPAQQDVNDRIVWVPGDAASGDIGKLGAPKWPGRNPRPLGTLEELFTVIITGHPPPIQAEDEEAQYRASRILFDAWYRAVYRSAHGTFAIQRAAWIINRKERRALGSIRVQLSLDAKLSDRLTGEIAGDQISGEFTMTMDETVDAPLLVPAPPPPAP